MAPKTELSLRSFYIFNSTLSKKEGEENKKILFYHPADIDIDTKIKDVGLSEAIIKFTGTFTSEDDCQALHTQKTTQIFNQPEKNFWIVMTINVPYETKNRDGSDYIEYKGGDIHDSIFRAVLRQTYNMFRLFGGTFETNFIGDTEDDKITNLKKKLELFYSKYLLTLKLQTCDIIDIVRSIEYLPLHKNLFLRVNNFINMIEATFPTIENTIFLYNDQLVWSEVNPTDLYSIHEYLVSTLFPKAIQSELQGGSMRRSHSMEYSHHGAFLTGPENKNSTKPAKVYIYNAGSSSCYYLVVYRSLNATICLFIDVKDTINEDFYSELHSFMGPQLTSIASEIGESFTKTSPTNNKQLTVETELLGPKYLCINELSLRHTGNIYLDHLHPKNTVIPPMVMNLIADLYHEDKQDKRGKFEEIVIKAVNDYWVVKKTSNWREFYVVIYNSKATMLEITNEAKKLFEQQISNVFFEKGV